MCLDVRVMCVLQSTPSLHQLNRLVLPPSSALPQSIPFNVPAHHYLSYVNPPDLMETSSSESMIATGDPLYLSFDERVLHFMRTARMIHFSELCIKMQIVHEQQMEHALHLLASMCWLVQGCWVLKSAIVYDRNWKIGTPVPHPTLAAAHSSMSSSRASRPVADRVQLSREYLITQFARRRVQYRDELLQTVQLELEPLDELLNELARCTTVSAQQQAEQGVASRAQWEWKINTDNTIAKQSDDTHAGTSTAARTHARRSLASPCLPRLPCVRPAVLCCAVFFLPPLTCAFSPSPPPSLSLCVLLLLSAFPRYVCPRNSSCRRSSKSQTTHSHTRRHTDEREEQGLNAHTRRASFSLCRLRSLLACSSAHSSRDPSTRGLLLAHSNTIVHAMSPAGLAAHRQMPPTQQQAATQRK